MAETLTVFFALLTVFSALYVAFAKNLLRISVAFFVELCSISVVLLGMGAEYLALIVLAVAVCSTILLISFSSLIMGNMRDALENEYSGKKSARDRILAQVLGMGLGSALALTLGYVLLKAPFFVVSASGLTTTVTGAHVLGDKLLGDRLAVFELLSVMILVSIVGSALLLRRPKHAD